MQSENKNEPLISIVVAVYNPQETHFRECMGSLQTQTYHNLEIILIDDGSKPEVAHLCDDYAQADLRIQVFHKKNGGISTARNMGIQMAQGEYLVFMDSDDYAAKDMIEKGYKMICQTHAQIAIWTFEAFNDVQSCTCHYCGPDQILFDKEEIWKYRALMLDALVFEDLQYALCMTTWGKMFKRSLFQENPDIRFDEKLRFGAEDNDFLQRFLPVTERMVLFHEDLYFYRVTQESMTSRFNPEFLDHTRTIMRKLKEDIQDDHRLVYAYNKFCCNQVLTACVNHVFHPNNPMGFSEKRKHIKRMLQMPEYTQPLAHIKPKDFPILKYLFMMCAKFHLYVGMMALGKGYVWKMGNKL